MLLLAVADGVDPAAAADEHDAGTDGLELAGVVVDREVAQGPAREVREEVGLVVHLAGRVDVGQVVGKDRGHLGGIAGGEGGDAGVVGFASGGDIGFGPGEGQGEKTEDQEEEGGV